MKAPRSKPEEQLDAALSVVFPNQKILHDMPIKVNGRTLYVDRVIKGSRLAIEIDGRQHLEFVAHFHGNADGFKSHKDRDAAKESWLHQNGYSLVRISHRETVTSEMLRIRVLEALSDG